ncbi:MAG: hypothetical protein CMO44_05870 [Verrucomicrobiales bacterium]|nr:hypothetical protein [Verrucomicrobiales bacterium]|tara:strand:- start:108 stop:302 length:195 start_codon:yes stop_codon:yes gene_type:complete
MTIDYDYQNLEVPPDILRYCDSFVLDAERNNLRYIDCVFMHMGEYGNDPQQLKEIRERIIPVFE